MANQSRTMPVSYRWTENAEAWRQVTHIQTVGSSSQPPNFGYSFMQRRSDAASIPLAVRRHS